MIYVGTVSINKRGVHDLKFQVQIALANAAMMQEREILDSSSPDIN